MFANHIRPELRRQHPTENQIEISKRAAARWNRMTEADKAPYVAFNAVEQLRFKHAVALYELEAPLREWENAPAPTAPPCASSTKHSVFNFWSAQPHVRSKLKAEILQQEPEAADEVSTTDTPARTTIPAAAATSTSSGEAGYGDSGTPKMTQEQVRPETSGSNSFWPPRLTVLSENRRSSSGNVWLSSGGP